MKCCECGFWTMKKGDMKAHYSLVHLGTDFPDKYFVKEQT